MEMLMEVTDLTKDEWIEFIRRQMKTAKEKPFSEVSLGDEMESIDLALNKEGRQQLRAEWSEQSVRDMAEQAWLQFVARQDTFPVKRTDGKVGAISFERLEDAEDAEFAAMVQGHLDWGVWSMEHQPGLWGFTPEDGVDAVDEEATA